MKTYPSIYNHTLAPITPGPSSSNTCGPIRVGYICNKILGEIPKKAVIEYSKNGAFVTTLFGMKSDIAFISGLLGMLQNDPEFLNAYQNAKKVGMQVEFKEVDDLITPVSEAARLRLTKHDGKEVVILGDSNGGGAVTVHQIDDCAVFIRGDQYELLLFIADTSEDFVKNLAVQASDLLKVVNEVRYSIGKNYSVIEIKTGYAIGKEVIQCAETFQRVTAVRVVDAVHPVVYSTDRIPPFNTPEEMLEYCEREGYDLYQAGLHYEMAISGWTEDEVRNYGNMLLKIMHNSLEQGMKSEMDMNGIVEAKAKGLSFHLGKKPLLSMGFLDEAVPAALGIMEFSNASGEIVCVPTGGSSGIVPAILITAAKGMKNSAESELRGLIASGIIGVLMAKNGNDFNGGECGCQVEIASGTAMASGGLVQILGGTPKQACDAASMCLQSFMGLICDPVAGLVQVPCFARNMSGVSVAAVSAMTVLSGFDPLLPFSEVTDMMIKVGRQIANTLGACCSGCSETPMGKRLAAEQVEKNKRVREV